MRLTNRFKKAWALCLPPCAVIALTVLPAHAQTYPLNQNNPLTASPSTLVGYSCSCKGYKLVANAFDLVTQLGARLPVSGEVVFGNRPGRGFTVYLWREDSQSLMATGSILLSDSPPRWQFADLATPVLLNAGERYRVCVGPDDLDTFNIFSVPPSPTNDALFKPTGNIELEGVGVYGLFADSYPRYNSGYYNTVDIGYELATVYTIGGTISGLDPSKYPEVLLSLNGEQYQWVYANGGFTFASPILSGTVYDVTVVLQPTGQTCTVTGGTGVATGNVTNVEVTCVSPPPDPPVLSITKTHVGNFAQGDTGKVYTITVGNTGASATSGTITVTDPLPTGLTNASASGTGWSCGVTGPLVTCTSSDAIAPSNVGNPITLTVDVAADAPELIDNVAQASGGGAANSPSATDPTLVLENVPVVLAVNKLHSGDFRQGQKDAIYTITVSNVGTNPTSGTITVVDELPRGLSYVSATGSGWSCGAMEHVVTCTTAAVIASGATASPIALVVHVAPEAPGSVVNTVVATGGGMEGSRSHSNPTEILPVRRKVAETPMLGNWALYSLALLLPALAGRKLRSSRRR